MASNSCYSSQSGIFKSPFQPPQLPSNPSLSMIQFLLRNASNYPDRVALADADTNKSLTFGELEPAIRRIAVALSRQGVSKNDVVLIFAPNSVDFPLCFFAIISLGAVATTVNPLYTVTELSKQALDSGAKLAITVPDLWPKVRELKLPTIFLTEPKNPHESKSYLANLLEHVGENPDFVAPQVQQTDLVALLYSSGTTGANKGVELTHRNFMATAMMMTKEQDLRGQPPHVCLCFLPMFHIFGMSVITYAQLQRGNTVVAMAKLEMEKMMEAVERFKVTMIPVVPPVMIAMAKQGKVTRYDLSSITRIISGAAPLGKDIMEEAAKFYPDVEISQVFIHT